MASVAAILMVEQKKETNQHQCLVFVCQYIVKTEGIKTMVISFPHGAPTKGGAVSRSQC